MRTHKDQKKNGRPAAQPVQAALSREAETRALFANSPLPTASPLPVQMLKARPSSHTPFQASNSQVIQREEWDPRDLDDKGSQKKNIANSASKSAFDKLGEAKGLTALKRFGSVTTRLGMVKEALESRDADALFKALDNLKEQFKEGTPPHEYVMMRLGEVKANKQAALNTMLAYHNMGNAAAKPDPHTAALTAQLKAHIMAAKNAYLSGNYQGAHDLLFNFDAAKLFGFGIQVTGGPNAIKWRRNIINYDDVGDLVHKAMPILEKAIFNPSEDHISLPYIMPYKGGVEEKYYDIPELAKMTIPVYLEEWMHVYQKKMRVDRGIPETTGTGAFWSQNTADYFKPHEGTERGKVGFHGINFNEIDILSAFHDWGFPVEELGTVGKGKYGDAPRYKVREDFWQWIKG